MQIDNLRDLKKVIKLCQDNGVTAIKIDGIEMTITPKAIGTSKIDYDAFPEAHIPVPTYNSSASVETHDSPIDMPDELSEEQLMYYSAKGTPQ